MQGDLAHAQGELREAVRCYLRAVNVDGQAIIHTLEPMVDCFRQLQGLEGLERYLGQHWRDTHYVPALIAQLECGAEQGDTSAAISQLLQELGYDVSRITTLDNPPFYQSVAQGDVDLWVNGWFPLHNSYEDAFSGGAEKVGYVAKGNLIPTGFCVMTISPEVPTPGSGEGR